MAESNDLNSHRPSYRRVWLRGGFVLLTVIVIALTAARCAWRYDDPKVAKFDSTRQGHFDFHNGVYLPSRAFLDGVSPYGARLPLEYPVTRPLPLLSPWTLLLHAPLALLPLPIAEWLYFGINVGLLAGIAWFCVLWIPDPARRFDWWCIALLLVFASRAGHTTLFTGYSTAELVLATLVALWYARSRPWLAAVAVAISSCKPTYSIPLFLLMMARGDRRAAWRGLALSIVLAIIPTLWLLRSTTPAGLLEDLRQGQASHMEDPYELPVNSWTRVDLMALVAKWTESAPGELGHLIVMVILLVPVVLALRKVNRNALSQFRQAQKRDVPTDSHPDTNNNSTNRAQMLEQSLSYVQSLSCGLIATSITCTIYHHVYDAVILIPVAVTMLLSAPGTERGSYRVRFIIGALLLFVPWNYISSEQFLSQLPLNDYQHKMLTSTGPIALAAGWVGMILLPWLPRQTPSQK